MLFRSSDLGVWDAADEAATPMKPEPFPLPEPEDLLLREFLGIRKDEETRLAANWIRSQQRPDGSWATFPGGPPELSTTFEAYAALRLAGDPADALHMRRAARVVKELGGLERTRVFTRIWMALFGLWPWRELPALPPEVILLPSWFPLHIYDFGCWARQTIVPLTVVASHRPVRPLPFALDEVNLDFQVIGQAPSSPEEVEVLIAASRKEKVEDRVAVAEAAGLKALVMDVESYAMQTAFELIRQQLPNEEIGRAHV